MRGLLLLTVGFLTAPLAGCAAQAIEDADDDAESRSIETWVVLERADADGQVRSNISAKFVQVASGDRALAFRLVGAHPAVPPSGDCVPLASIEARAVLPGDSIQTSGTTSDLVDAGDVTISVKPAAPLGDSEHSREIRLSPRAFPDVADFVSGVFYTSPDATSALPAGARYSLTASGSQLVDSFFIEVDAPEAPIITWVGDKQAAQGESVATVRSDIHLAWEAPPGVQGSVYVDLRAATTHRCTFPDQGAAVLPSEILSGADRGAATLTLHRLVERHVPMASDSSDEVREALVLFDFARTTRLTIR